jgi:hypothetical protein
MMRVEAGAHLLHYVMTRRRIIQCSLKSSR